VGVEGPGRSAAAAGAPPPDGDGDGTAGPFGPRPPRPLLAASTRYHPLSPPSKPPLFPTGRMHGTLCPDPLGSCRPFGASRWGPRYVRGARVLPPVFLTLTHRPTRGEGPGKGAPTDSLPCALFVSPPRHPSPTIDPTPRARGLGPPRPRRSAGSCYVSPLCGELPTLPPGPSRSLMSRTNLLRVAHHFWRSTSTILRREYTTEQGASSSVSSRIIPLDRSFNRVTLIGRVGTEPKQYVFTKPSEQGEEEDSKFEFVRFVLATKDPKYPNQTTQPPVDWHTIVVRSSSRSLNYVKNFVRKGDQILVEGILKYRLVQVGDKPPIKLTEIVVNSFGRIDRLQMKVTDQEPVPEEQAIPE